uniref:Apple domain-containing protein n=1 Tax=Cyprinodon variegatus TaxID=28743 RepID=A0A3Q2D220_CYPVA
MVSYFLAYMLLIGHLSFCQACQTQLFQDTDFPGNDFLELKAVSPEYCQFLCSVQPLCTYFSFSSNNFGCILKNNPNSLVVQSKRGVTSGIPSRFCRIDESWLRLTYEGVDFFGSDFRSEVVRNADDCQQTCTQNPNCQFFTYITEICLASPQRNCHLKFSWNIPRTPIVEKKTGVTSGFALKTKQTQEFPTTCQQQLFPNTDIPGSNIEKLKSVSPEHCQVLCSANPQCTYFSFSSDDFSCYLKNNQRVLTAKPKKGTTSGIPARFCQLDDNWVKQLYQGVDFRGSDFEKELMDDAELCQRKCDEDATCQFFTYVDQTFSDSAYWRRCYLKRVITMPAPPRVNKLHNAVSGFNLRNCQGVFV